MSIVWYDGRKGKRRVMPLMLFTRYTVVFLSLLLWAYRQSVSLFVVVDVRSLEQTEASECLHIKLERKHLVIFFSLSLLLVAFS